MSQQGWCTLSVPGCQVPVTKTTRSAVAAVVGVVVDAIEAGVVGVGTALPQGQATQTLSTCKHT